MQQTNVDRALEALEERHASDPERAELVRLTRRFKSSWIELGAALTEARRNKSWERWGFDSFEAYARTELRLRADTVDKLTASFMFLHKRAPEVLERDPLESVPSYHAIDYLRRAEESAAMDESIPREALVDVRKQILEEGAPVAKVARLYNDTLFPVSEEDRREANRRALRLAANKLRGLLTDSNAVSTDLADAIRASLESLLAELEEAAKKAA